MLHNLEAELVRKGYKPAYKAIMKSLDCAEKTARNKLMGVTDVTVPEAIKIRAYCFPNDGFSLEYLFDTNISA